LAIDLQGFALIYHSRAVNQATTYIEQPRDKGIAPRPLCTLPGSPFAISLVFQANRVTIRVLSNTQGIPARENTPGS